jgi:nitrite reductase (cytochrome c-552)
MIEEEKDLSQEKPKKASKTVWLLSGVIVILAVVLIGVLLFLKNQPQPTRGVAPIIEIADMDPNSENWGVNFPNQ